MVKKVLIITDNQRIYDYRSSKQLELSKLAYFSFAYTITNKHFLEKYGDGDTFFSVCVKKDVTTLQNNYDLIISWHCKQLFPPDLVNNVRCINIHPGLNPYNRGWFPQVFSILNKKPCGATIHIIDNELDHGPIIVQQEVRIEDADTSETAYNRIIETEITLFEDNILSIVNGTYITYIPKEEGNINNKKDFAELCKLDLNKVITLGESIDLLRALTFKDYKNAFFTNSKGKKVFISVSLHEEDE